MKRLVLVLLIFLLILSLTSCSQKTKTEKKKSDESVKFLIELMDEEEDKDESLLREIETPMWSSSSIQDLYPDDIKDDDKLVISEKTVSKQPLFCNKPVPFKFKIGYKQNIYNESEKLLEFYDFGDSTVYYMCKGSKAVGAFAIEGSGFVGGIPYDKYPVFFLAEARIIEPYGPFEENEEPKLEIEEFHYKSANHLVFRCMSQFDDDGLKISETGIIGEKETDYFFLWPTEY